MKITFTLGQVKQFNSLPAEERERILTGCDRLSEMTDDAIDAYRPESGSHEIVAEVHSSLVKRVAAKRRRSERKAAGPKKLDAAVAEAAIAEAANTATEMKVTLTEGAGRAAISLRNTFNQFVNQVLSVLGMLKENEEYRNMAAMWKVISEFIYKTIHPLADYAKQYMRLPRQQRRPWTFNIPVALD